MVESDSKANQSNIDIDVVRHSTAHVLAEAVQSLFPETKFGIGPTIENGFYYDFDLPRPLTPEDLPRIEDKMREVIKSNSPFIREQVSKEDARKIFAAQPYKLELIDELPDSNPTIYRQGQFVDLCRGPHIMSTGQVKAFKLMSIAGAYWRGDEKRPMLQRVYGVAFPTGEELEKYLKQVQEAERRDHRRIGKELDLFGLVEEAGAGLVLWHPKGALIRKTIEDFWKEEHYKRGYELVYTPHIFRADLWKISGHLEMYKEYLYSPMEIEGQQYLLKPMNCPGHILIYKSRLRSYRELPLRMAELGTVYRFERSGVLHGLTRVRGFTQDDAHIFCRPDHLESEIIGVLELAKFMMKTFGFSEYEIMLSTRPGKYAGTIEVWEKATAILESALNKIGLPFKIDPGEGVFYGPKIDIKLKDALGRAWQGPTIQVDFNLPQRFEVNYIAEDGKEHLVVMIHRTVLGSMERFFGCLIEHYAGAFPVWLAPVQALIIPIADRHTEYCNKICHDLCNKSIRAQVDSRSERMNLKIREAQLQKIPYMLVVGDKEQELNQVAVRLRNGDNLGAISIKECISQILQSIENKSLAP